MRISINQPEIFATIFEKVTKTKLLQPITGISNDSREIREGDLYIALKGEKVDGHKFIIQSKKAGAHAALVMNTNYKVDLQQITTDKPIDTIGKIANKWRKRFKIPIIGITGSNGKTSTKDLLSHVLSSKYNVHATKGNFNTIIGVPLTLLEIDNKHDISIIEMGASVPGEITNLCNIAEPTHGLITNIAPAHLEGFGSIETIAYEKGALFRYLKKGLSFVNTTDKMVSTISFKGKRKTYGLNPDCDFPADIFTEEDGSITLIIDANIIKTGSHNLSFIKNCISTAAISSTLGVNWNLLQNKLNSFKATKGRCFVKKIHDITIIDDTYNANLTSSLAALDYLKAFSGIGRKIFVFGDMYELGSSSNEQHHKVGIKCSEIDLDILFTIGNHTKYTGDAVSKSLDHKHFNSMDSLISTIKKILSPGDKILFKGSRGMQMEKVINGVFN